MREADNSLAAAVVGHGFIDRVGMTSNLELKSLRSVILVIKRRASTEQLKDMLQVLGDYVKLAVDVRRNILAGGGVLHADCESALLEDGSQQVDVWGADWVPRTQEVTYESLINIRPRQGNRGLELLDPELRATVERIAREWLGGVPHE